MRMIQSTPFLEAAAERQVRRMTRKPSFQIRVHTYHNRVGFLVIGTFRNPAKIFTETRASAEHIRAELRKNPHYTTTLEDFRIPDAS